MDKLTISREKKEEFRAQIRDLLNPERFLDSLEVPSPEEDRALLNSQINDVINKNFPPLPPLTEVERRTEQFDGFLDGFGRSFPDGLSEPTDQVTIKPDFDKTVEKLDPFTIKTFERDLIFAKALGDTLWTAF